VDGTSVKTSWSAVTGAAGYQLYRSTSSAGTYTRVYSGIDRTYTDTGLTSGKAYYYKVRAYAAVGYTKVYGPFGTAKAGIPLAAPAISSAAASGSTSIKVSWGAASSATGYQLYRSTSETGTYARVYSGTARAYTNTGLTTGKAYFYKVRAYKVIGTTTYYGPFGAVKIGVPLAAAKTPTVSAVDGTSVKTSWSAVTGAAGYQLLCSTSATGTYASVYIGTERTFMDTGLTAGTAYNYKVRAYKLVGTETCYGPYSAYKVIKPL
jgi:fibronectin type 3 domain-containing protein